MSLPPDPFRELGPLLSDLGEASMLWDAVRDLPIEEAVRAVRALDAEDVRAMVIATVLTERLRFRVNTGEGCVSFDREPPGDGGSARTT